MVLNLPCVRKSVSRCIEPQSTHFKLFSEVPFSSVTHSLSRVRLCDPRDYSTPGLPVHHQLPELAQTHVHRVSGAIQLSLPLLSASPLAFNLSQHQRLFK